MLLIKLSLLILFFAITIFFSYPVSANFQKTGCKNRYVTLVNPVRGRNLWVDKNVKYLLDQYNLINAKKFSATWLLQYEVLKDTKLLSEIKSFDNKHEKGLLLEVSEDFANDSGVIYPYNAPWFNPRVVFFSGYSQSDRKKLADKLFEAFKNQFGYYPKSVGAWWIDSYTLKYLYSKYKITSALIVADQKTTDNYAVWGGWWGVPYYPSKTNILTPASNLSDKLDLVILQWAQRDLTLAYGEGPKYSNYSLQANDYIRQGKNTNYFKDLTNIYLDCQNPIGQITVGLETGMESVGYIGEYKNQLNYLDSLENLESVTFSQFFEKFQKVYPKIPEKIVLKDQSSTWVMTPDLRSNEKLNDRIKYSPAIAFSDYFVKDTSDFLDRRLTDVNKQKDRSDESWAIFIVLILSLVLAYYKKFMKPWIIGFAFTIACFGLILRSKYQYGFKVYYGVEFGELLILKILSLISGFFIIFTIYKIPRLKNILLIVLIPLSFGFDALLGSIRYIRLEEVHFFGFALGSLKLIGISIQKPYSINFVNQDFPSYQAAAFLRFNFAKIWDNFWISMVIYPLLHIILGLILGFFLLKTGVRFRKFVIFFLLILYLWHILNIVFTDPRVVTPII